MFKLSSGLVPFWNDYMIDWSNTNAILSVNKPIKKQSVMEFDKPWDGNGNDFFAIVHDDGLYRMYYLTWSIFDDTYKEGINVCYAESKDGINWVRPNLGICDFRGSKENNIIMTGVNDIYVMKDENPDCKPEHKYKAVMFFDDISDVNNFNSAKSKKGLISLVSADGIHFKKYRVISQGYEYDSQNSLHWNPNTKKYYCYFRYFKDCLQPENSQYNETRQRGILVVESEDCINWSEPVPLNFNGKDEYPLYTNCIMAYPFDTRYYIGFPTRYVERKEWTSNYDRLCGVTLRKKRMEVEKRLGLVVTDCVFMSSRDNYNWYRFDEACITPGPEYDFNWVYGDCYPAIGGLIETPSDFDGEPNELSIYLFNHHLMPKQGALIRYAYRRDGFASVKADYSGKILTTKPFILDADELMLNFATSARGGIELEILDQNGETIEGYKTCEIFGDSIERIVDFSKPLSALKGETVALKFKMRDAEIYSMRFN